MYGYVFGHVRESELEHLPTQQVSLGTEGLPVPLTQSSQYPGLQGYETTLPIPSTWPAPLQADEGGIPS